MLLVIDIGNTNTTIGVYDGESLKSNWRTETKKATTADELALLFRDFLSLSHLEFGQIDGIAISNVVPSVQHAFLSMGKRYFDVEPLYIDPSNIGIGIKYPNPAEIGADRLVNAVAAYEKYKKAAIIVDFGTATTFDYVDATGAYCGGVIAPGVAISNEALYQWTSKLPRVDIVAAKDVLGKSTIEAIQSGVYHGYRGLVQHLIDMMKKEVGGDPKIVATGGLASLIVKDLDIEVDRNLTLEGLRIVYSRYDKAS